MPTDRDLFAEEQPMVAMSFGDHIEELRARLILALLGLMVGVVLTFIPPLNLGKRVMTKMQEPAQGALNAFYTDRAEARAEEAEKAEASTPVVRGDHPRRDLRRRADAGSPPSSTCPRPSSSRTRSITLPFQYDESGMIKTVAGDRRAARTP